MAVLSPSARSEHVTFASTRSLSNAPFLIAERRGYFTAEGIEAEHAVFDASGPITLAVTTGDADIGATGLSGAFFNLAAEGKLRIIGGYVTDAAGFPGIAYVASNRAWAGGLHTLKDIGGHSAGVTQVGTGLQFSVALLAETLGFDIRTVRIVPLQSYPNALSAATGGSIDVAVVPTNYARPAVDAGNVKFLGNLGDVVAIQTGMMFVSAKSADERAGMIERFLRAFRHGARDYYDAFVGPDGRPAKTAEGPAMLALLAEAADEPVAQVQADITYIDPDARVRVSDVMRQANWYKQQGMVRGKIDGDTLVDRRYALLFAEP